VRHANQRVRHFFLFLFAVDAACRRVAANGGAAVAPASAVQEKATHQIDAGFRSADAAYEAFDVANAGVIGTAATAFGRTDAAHFCNLGLRQPAWPTLRQAATGDAVAQDLMLLAEKLAGDTAQLPQRINIGPDRVIDMLHATLAQRFLGAGTPVFSTANLQAYLAEAASAIGLYRAGHVARGNHGIAACCDAYLQVYATAGDAIWPSVRGMIYAECAGLRLNDADYIGY